MNMQNDQIKILIAEDEYITAMDFKNTLQKAGYKVIGIVSTGEALIESIEKEKPTLIISDINLKGELDGIEAIARIQEKYDIPFIYVTAFDDYKKIVESYHLKPCDFVLKPVQSKQLRDLVKSCLSQLI